MAEYIERDEAIRKAIDACIKVVGHGITQFDAVDIAEMIDSIPAADVVEVRHGEWIDVPYPNNPNWEPRKRCSICGRFVRRKTENYCPDCGAKMSGKDGAE